MEFTGKVAYLNVFLYSMTVEQMEKITSQAPGKECGTAEDLLFSEWTLSSKAKPGSPGLHITCQIRVTLDSISNSKNNRRNSGGTL